MVIVQRFDDGAHIVAELFGEHARLHLLQKTAHNGGTVLGGGQKLEDFFKVNVSIKRISASDDLVHHVFHRNDFAVGKDGLERLAVFQNVLQVAGKVAVQQEINERGHIDIQVFAGFVRGKRQVDQTVVVVNIGGEELLGSADFFAVYNIQHFVQTKAGNVIAKLAAQVGADFVIRQKSGGVNIGNVSQFYALACAGIVIVQCAENSVCQVGKIVVCRIGHEGFQNCGGNADAAGFQQLFCQCRFAVIGDGAVQYRIQRVGIIVVLIFQQILDLLHGGQSAVCLVKGDFARVGNGGFYDVQIIICFAFGKRVDHLRDRRIEAALLDQAGNTGIGDGGFGGVRIIVVVRCSVMLADHLCDIGQGNEFFDQARGTCLGDRASKRILVVIAQRTVQVLFQHLDHIIPGRIHAADLIEPRTTRYGKGCLDGVQIKIVVVFLKDVDHVNQRKVQDLHQTGNAIVSNGVAESNRVIVSGIFIKHVQNVGPGRGSAVGFK